MNCQVCSILIRVYLFVLINLIQIMGNIDSVIESQSQSELDNDFSRHVTYIRQEMANKIAKIKTTQQELEKKQTELKKQIADMNSETPESTTQHISTYLKCMHMNKLSRFMNRTKCEQSIDSLVTSVYTKMNMHDIEKRSVEISAELKKIKDEN